MAKSVKVMVNETNGTQRRKFHPRMLMNNYIILFFRIEILSLVLRLNERVGAHYRTLYIFDVELCENVPCAMCTQHNKLYLKIKPISRAREEEKPKPKLFNSLLFH